MKKAKKNKFEAYLGEAAKLDRSFAFYCATDEDGMTPKGIPARIVIDVKGLAERMLALAEANGSMSLLDGLVQLTVMAVEVDAGDLAIQIAKSHVIPGRPAPGGAS